MPERGAEQDRAVLLIVVACDGKAGEGLARVDHQAAGLDGLVGYGAVQGQVVDAVAVATMGLALLDQDAGASG